MYNIFTLILIMINVLLVISERIANKRLLNACKQFRHELSDSNSSIASLKQQLKDATGINKEIVSQISERVNKEHKKYKEELLQKENEISRQSESFYHAKLDYEGTIIQLKKYRVFLFTRKNSDSSFPSNFVIIAEKPDFAYNVISEEIFGNTDIANFNVVKESYDFTEIERNSNKLVLSNYDLL